MEQVDFVIAVNALHHRRQTLHAHTGINGRFRQRAHFAILGALILHEHQVPNLDVTVAIFLRRSRWPAPNMFAVIIENFGARPARPGITHLPEIVGSVTCSLIIADAGNAISWHTDLLRPNVIGFVVFRVNRHPQLAFGQFQHFGEEFPRILNRIVFEIIAKTEVAEHFKKGVVTCSVTNIFQVVMLAARTHATLRSRRTVIGAYIVAQKHVLELHHACVGEQQGRVIARYQRAGRKDFMAFAGEKIEKMLSEFSSIHWKAALIASV